jgi:hypothetical protein
MGDAEHIHAIPIDEVARLVLEETSVREAAADLIGAHPPAESLDDVARLIGGTCVVGDWIAEASGVEREHVRIIIGF